MNFFKEPANNIPEFLKTNENRAKNSGNIIKNTPNTEADLKCPKHIKENLQFYCLDCENSEPICSICYIEHTQLKHDVYDIEKAWKIVRDVQIKEIIQTKINIAQSNAYNLYINLFNKNKQLESKLLQNQKVIQKRKNEILNKLNEFEKYYSEKYEQITIGLQNSINVKSKHLASELERLTNNLDELNKIETQSVHNQCDWYFHHNKEILNFENIEIPKHTINELKSLIYQIQNAYKTLYPSINDLFKIQA